MKTVNHVIALIIDLFIYFITRTNNSINRRIILAKSWFQVFSVGLVQMLRENVFAIIFLQIQITFVINNHYLGDVMKNIDLSDNLEFMYENWS